MSDQVLPAAGFLETLDLPARTALGAAGEFFEVGRGAVVIQQGQLQDALYFVISGVLHARRQAGARELLLGRIESGEWFGEVNLFDPGTAIASVVSPQSARLWRIRREAVETFINDHPHAGGQLLIGLSQLLSQRLRAVTDRVVNETSLAETLAEMRLSHH